MASSCRRPEHMAPPEIFYNEEEAKKYSQNSRMIEIQSQMSERAVELLNLPEDQPCFLLDVGCGSGLSGDYLSEEGHFWVGVDISTAMLDVALDREVEGDLVLGDMGEGLPFRPGTFDGCISISALQWLCNADKKTHSPPKRLYTFFSTLYSSLSRGARAVFQLYPENSEQLELITSQAMKAGFSGGMVVDYPNSTKAKKFFLCLFAGFSGTLPKGLVSETVDRDVPNQVQFTGQRSRFRNMKGKSAKKGKDWVLEKKERRRRQGRYVPLCLLFHLGRDPGYSVSFGQGSWLLCLIWAGILATLSHLGRDPGYSVSFGQGSWLLCLIWAGILATLSHLGRDPGYSVSFGQGSWLLCLIWAGILATLSHLGRDPGYSVSFGQGSWLLCLIWAGILATLSLGSLDPDPVQVNIMMFI
uniref:18S rRNA (guanine-N(7))-methyltransferase n=1 Tax=Oncorhynchus mykiss TaxID=8022 RepID=A0A8C7QMU0_ONCMY